MDEIHKRMINSHINELKGTHFERLIHALERLDKENKVIPPRLLTVWKELKRVGYDQSKANEQFYCDIQRRGPKAFQLLVDSLNDSGQNELACLLDPTLREQETDDADDEQPMHYEYYSDEGDHYFYLDQSWSSTCYDADLEALKNLFIQLGFTPLPPNGWVVKPESLGSLVVINFCALANGGVVRENLWLEKFSDPTSSLFGKPKILMSIRYKGMISSSQTAQDSGMSQKPHKDILQLKILVTPSQKNDEYSVSEEMQHLVDIFGRDDSLHIKDKVKQLNQALEDSGLDPVILHDSDFSKRFRLNKSLPLS